MMIFLSLFVFLEFITIVTDWVKSSNFVKHN